MASDNNTHSNQNLLLLKQQHLIFEAIERNSLFPSSKLYTKQFPDIPILPSVSTDRIFVTEGYCLLSESILVCYDSKMNTGWWLEIVLWESSKDWSLTLILIQPWESVSTESVWWSTRWVDDHRFKLDLYSFCGKRSLAPTQKSEMGQNNGIPRIVTIFVNCNKQKNEPDIQNRWRLLGKCRSESRSHCER